MAEGAGGDSRPSPYPLTERELGILELLVAGRGDDEIADSLDVSERTVSIHRRRIYGKIGVRSRAEAVEWARARRLFEDANSSE